MQNKVHDITGKFTRASNALDVGQLVKDEYFTLFESIGAIEIMDPKMDSGFLQNNETLEETYDPLTPLLPAELIGIMDQLLCYEMAWHTGYPLSQTLFTSIHMDRLLWPEAKVLERAQFYRGEIAESKRPGTLLEVLRAYCLAVVKGCDYVIAKVQARDYFEEEDFCTNTYHRVLFVRVPLDVFERELDAAVELMEETDLDIDDSLRSAIITRLNFRKAFLRALDIDLPLEQLSTCWPHLLESLDSIRKTHDLGNPVPGAFSTKMQRRLASTVPPRPVVELDFNDALEKLQQLCIDCSEATRFTDLPLDPLEYISFLCTFANRNPTPLPYSRSYLATILFHPDILNSPISLPLTDTKSFVFPAPTSVLDPINWTLSPPLNPLHPKTPKLQLAMLIDEFTDRTGQPYLDLWVALGQNHCRLRRMLAHVVVGWDMLQADAVSVDSDLHTVCQSLRLGGEIMDSPLSTWVYIKKLWMMEKFILLGFEQDIYLPDEFAGMYYFLHLLASRRVATLQKCVDHGTARMEEFARTGNVHDKQDTQTNLFFIDAELQHATAISLLAKALYKYYTVLLYLGLLPIPSRSRTFCNEQRRYELRMKPFLSLTPPEVPPFAAWSTALEPWGSYAEPGPSLVVELRDSASGLWRGIRGALDGVMEALGKVEGYGAEVCKAGGVDVAWKGGIVALRDCCVEAGVEVGVVREVVEGGLKEGDGEGKGGSVKVLGARVEIPGEGSQVGYFGGWVVAKVLRDKE
ncbi:amino-acid N-acetyltransferas-like protein subunit Mak10 [Massarina eburnea CBS 473.64]|uniref:Amino-acid N-acetyltransferas-like protein subunit Mak10 n=1 Tax=Massarina eburnea CBS 473.64 TaxID=1395130 RepID=A0A6A6RZF8_9PLEO|nr:amino-acid N-acetyltransferas-like protein subunit Mak10 [Massarina eburnea CBS 473.64]